MLPSISIDDDRFEEYGVVMALKEVWLVLMLWTGLEDGSAWSPGVPGTSGGMTFLVDFGHNQETLFGRF